MKKITKRILSLSMMTAIALGLAVGDYYAVSYHNLISQFFGVGEQIGGDFKEIDDSSSSGDEVVRKIGNDGVVLLKNEDKDGKAVLPLNESKTKVNILGACATDEGFLLVGNGSGCAKPHQDLRVSLLDAFEEENIEYNKELLERYSSLPSSYWNDWGEKGAKASSVTLKEPDPNTLFSQSDFNQAKAFSDTAIVVISRFNGEFSGRIDTTQKKANGSQDTSRYYNEITKEEEDLLKLCTANFDKVIVLLNTGSVMNMSFLDDPAIGHISAALNVGYMGQSAATAIPKILYGKVNPSGHLDDTVAYDFKNDEPSHFNGKRGHDSLVYQEDIYVGYKWFETADAEGFWNERHRNSKSGYDAVVQYPFGYGLSYTTFDWELVSSSLSIKENSSLQKNSEISFDVKVTNTGAVPGKDVVQVYYTAPYYKNGIEKASVNLVRFAKTPELKPQESTKLHFTITPYDMASYDCYSLNDNDMTGWELDPGTYSIKLMTDSHHLKDMVNNELTYNVDYIIRYKKDPTTNKRIKNRFTGDLAYGEMPLDGENLETGKKPQYLSRADFKATFTTNRLTPPSVTSAQKDYVYDGYNFTEEPVLGEEHNLRLVTKDDGSFASADDFNGKNGSIKLKYNSDLINELGNPETGYNNAKWDDLLNQLTKEDLHAAIEGSGYKTSALASVGKPVSIEYDGPAGFNRTNLSPNVASAKMTSFPSEALIGQTWNEELTYQMGQIIGIDGQNFNISGIYGPAVNLHRESMNERNYEYYSEDPLLSGYLASGFIKGANSNGVHSYLKHLALYDSSNYAYSNIWCTEQALREIYLKPYEIAIKYGQCNGIMSAYNKVGATWAGANYAMINGIIREEFGFRGTVISDYDNNEDSMNINAGLRGGNDTWLNPQYPSYRYPTKTWSRFDSNDVTHLNLARNATKNILYTFCNTYYYSTHKDMNNPYAKEVSTPKTVEQGFEWWIHVVVGLNVLTLIGFIIWNYYLFKPEGFHLSDIYKKKKHN